MSEILPIHALKAQIIQHALDMMHSAKCCDPPVLYEGHWYPMICPIEGDFQ